MAVHRFQFDDPHDTDPTTNSYVFPQNPARMTSPLRDRAMTTDSTTAGGTLAWEGARPAKSFQITGPTLNRAQYDAFQDWMERPNRFTLTDHYGRVITVLPVSFEHTPQNRVKNYWAGDYTLTFLAVSVSAPTVGDIWS